MSNAPSPDSKPRLSVWSIRTSYQPVSAKSSFTTQALEQQTTSIPAKMSSSSCKLDPNCSPEYPIWSTQEAFYQLRKCLGVHATSFHSIDITPIEYKSTKYIVGIDTEKVLSAGFTGLNTKAGDLMTVKFNRMPTDATAPDKMYIILHADIVMNIRDTGVEIFE